VALVQRRIGAIFAAGFALLALAGARTLYLATLHSGALRRAAQNQQLTSEAVPAQRGTISDRNGVDLAVSEPAQDISATPYLLTDPLAAAQRLAPLLGSEQDAVLRKLSTHSGFVYLARALPAKQAQEVLALKIPGINGTPVMHRVYPRGKLAAQVLGVLGTEGNGLAGLEYSANSLLHGHTGQRRVVSDAVGHPVSITDVHPETGGSSISLTLDANVQQRVEEVLGAVGGVFSPKDATAIVMDPRDGSIIAMASWPTVDANHPGNSSPEALENRAVGFAYEPGSTFKAFTVAGALQQGLITPNSGFTVPDHIKVADRVIHDDTEHGYESLTTAQILAQSSNVGAIEIGMLEGATRFNDWVRRFGFGARTGVELPGEERGLILSLDHYSGSSMGNLPIGQGQLVTPLQMASAYAAIANGGILRPAHLIRTVDGRARALPAGRQVISPETAASLRQMLEGVLAPGGTASEVSIPGYQLAGKTGTAQKIDHATGEYSKTAYIASFLGFAPAKDPKLLCAVVVDEPQAGSIFGGTVAAPAFGQIMSFALPYLGISPG
jgi:cell division protein FtsI (penicillin-binding protein 3)